MFYFALFLSQHLMLQRTHRISVCYFSELMLPNGIRHSPKYQPHHSLLVETVLLVMPCFLPSAYPSGRPGRTGENNPRSLRAMSDFLGTKHQSSVNTSKFQGTNTCLFKELLKFYFLLLWGYNNSSKSNFRFLSSPEGCQKDVFNLHTPKQRQRPMSLKERLFLQKQNQKRLKTRTNLESIALNVPSFLLFLYCGRNT